VYIIKVTNGGKKEMKFLSVRDLRGKSAEIWKELPNEREMIITSNGRPIAILASISESNLEESLAAFRQARAVEAVASLQRRSADQGTDKISMDEIDDEIKNVRKKRATAQ
jgi:antitoxin (DNA-binding transcriptional repressor) of toxin-antitoxin stability system